jgi:hypothetical protein
MLDAANTESPNIKIFSGYSNSNKLISKSEDKSNL